MDEKGNLTQDEKLKLATLLIKAKMWWETFSPSLDHTLELIDLFEDFRKEIEKE